MMRICDVTCSDVLPDFVRSKGLDRATEEPEKRRAGTHEDDEAFDAEEDEQDEEDEEDYDEEDDDEDDEDEDDEDEDDEDEEEKLDEEDA